MTLIERLRRPNRIRLILITAGVIGWGAFVWLLSRMFSANPPRAGFDLELLIVGGRHVAAGASPYSQAMLGGGPVDIADLFYTYPPLVAQVFSLIAGVPSALILSVTVALASVAAILVGRAVAVETRSEAVGRATLLPLAALLPFWFPYTIAMLFGNVDMFFPALYGLVLIAVLRPGDRPGAERWVVVGGVALAVAALIKLHPAVLGVWLLARGWRERRRGEDIRPVGPLRLPRSWRIAAVAVGIVALALAVSLAAGGLAPWQEYVAVLRAGASVDLLDTRNLGPAVQLVMLFGLGPSAVGPLQVVVLGLAMVVTVVAALRVDDPLESLAWGAVASFVVLPVTWFHHFAALVPFGIGALVRGAALGAHVVRRLAWLVAIGFATVTIGFAQPPTWLLVVVFVAAARVSRSETGRRGPDDGSSLEPQPERSQSAATASLAVATLAAAPGAPGMRPSPRWLGRAALARADGQDRELR